MNRETNYGTIWVCVCCLLNHANGECGCQGNDENAHTLSRDAKGRYDGGTVNGDGIPLSRITRGYHVAMGMSRDEHECHSEDCASLCTDCDHDHGCDCEGDDECECERNNFSHSQCEGCGSWLYGQREAMTLFKSPRRRKPKTPAPAPRPTALTTYPVPTVDELIALIESPPAPADNGEHYVVTFDSRPVAGLGALVSLKRTTLAEARTTLRLAAHTRPWGRIIDARTLEVVN